MGNKIILKAKRKNHEVIRVTAEAVDVLRALRLDTGLPLSEIASQLIVQAAPIVEIQFISDEE